MTEEKVASGRTGPDGKINVEVPPGRYEVRILRIGGPPTPAGGGGTPAGGGGGAIGSGGDGTGTLISGALTDYGTVVPAGKDLHSMRKAIIAKAISMCGTVDAAENPTKGVDVLMDIFQTAAPMYGPFSPDKFQPGMKQPASWCGIFNLYCCIKVGATTETWKVGKGPAFPVKFGNANIIPGDICQIPHNSHFFIITAKSGNTVKTCEGNTWFRRIVQKQRDVSEICAVFRTVPEDFVAAGSSPPPPGPGGDATGGGEQPPPGGPPLAKAPLEAQPKTANAPPTKVIIGKDGKATVVSPPPPPPGAAPPPSTAGGAKPPPGPKSDPPTSKDIQVKLVEPDVDEAAKESKFGWGEQVTIDIGGTAKSQVVDGTGATTFKDVAGPGKVTRVVREGLHTNPLVWATEPKEGQPGTTIEVPLKTRLRLSSWVRSFGLLYADMKVAKLDWARCESILDAMKGKVDDVLILNTFIITGGDAKPPLVRDGDFWSDFSKFDDIARKLIDLCHARAISVQAGFAVVNEGMGMSPRGKNFVALLEKGNVEAFGQDLAARSKALGFDGVGFDLEINGLQGKHKDAVGRLIAATAKAMGDGLVSYAPAPFESDESKHSLGFAAAQPYALAKLAPNIVARPQAYREVKESAAAWQARILRSVRYALSVGLHPSQLQMGLSWTGDAPDMLPKPMFGSVSQAEFAACARELRKLRVGAVCWRVERPGSPGAADWAAWDNAFNSGTKPPGTEGQPLHVPLRKKG